MRGAGVRGHQARSPGGSPESRRWGVVGGWAIDLFVGRATRYHGDIEIAIPADRSPRSPGRYRDSSGMSWVMDGSGPTRLLSVGSARHGSVSPRSGLFLLDVFRESHDGATWTFRRDPAIMLPYADAYARTSDGVPYLVPELALLFKARHVRPQDQHDFDAVLPLLDEHPPARLRCWLERTEPGHPWLADL